MLGRLGKESLWCRPAERFSVGPPRWKRFSSLDYTRNCGTRVRIIPAPVDRTGVMIELSKRLRSSTNSRNQEKQNAVVPPIVEQPRWGTSKSQFRKMRIGLSVRFESRPPMSSSNRRNIRPPFTLPPPGRQTSIYLPSVERS